MRTGPREGWILAGVLDGTPAFPPLTEDVAGLPYVLRLALDLAIAGVKQITVIWTAPSPAPSPELAAILADRRLTSRAAVEVVTTVPAGGDDADPIAVVRADRIGHRDMPKQAIAAWRSSSAAVGRVGGDADDGVVTVSRAVARDLVAAAPRAHGIADVLAGLPAERAELPYHGFTAA